MADNQPIVVKSFQEVGAHLTDHDARLTQAENVTNAAEKVWKGLKVGFPIILGAIVAASGASSPIGKAITFILQAMGSQ